MAHSEDLLGNALTDVERELHDMYLRLEELSKSEDLAPCVTSNVRFASAALWQIVTDLNISTVSGH